MPDLIAAISLCRRPGSANRAGEIARRAAQPLLERGGRRWAIAHTSSTVFVGMVRQDACRTAGCRHATRAGIAVAMEGYLAGSNALWAGEGDDAGVVARAYLSEGLKGVERLEGSFLIVLIDGRANLPYLWTDPTGSLPWFRAVVDEHLVVVPELKCLTV